MGSIKNCSTKNYKRGLSLNFQPFGDLVISIMKNGTRNYFQKYLQY